MFTVKIIELQNARSHACETWRCIITNILKEFYSRGYGIHQDISVDFSVFKELYCTALKRHLKEGDYLPFFHFCCNILQYMRDYVNTNGRNAYLKFQTSKKGVSNYEYDLYKEVEKIMNNPKIAKGYRILQKYKD